MTVVSHNSDKRFTASKVIFLGDFSVSCYPGGVRLCFLNIFSVTTTYNVLSSVAFYTATLYPLRTYFFSHTYYSSPSQLTLSIFDSSISSSLLQMHSSILHPANFAACDTHSIWFFTLYSLPIKKKGGQPGECLKSCDFKLRKKLWLTWGIVTNIRDCD